MEVLFIRGRRPARREQLDHAGKRRGEARIPQLDQLFHQEHEQQCLPGSIISVEEEAESLAHHLLMKRQILSDPLSRDGVTVVILKG
jgi:hypothetical protein